jgi:hypothetical protein
MTRTPAPKLPGASDTAASIVPIRPGVRPISSDNIRRIFGPHVITEVAAKPDPVELLRRSGYRPSLGERLVDFFRTRGDRLFVFLIGITFGLLLADAIAIAVRGL